MSEQQDFLIEIGCEELPPKALLSLIQRFEKEVVTGLDNLKLSHGKVKSYAAPRRLALFIQDLASQQPDHQVERKGPALKAAFDEKGEPTQAALGFAKSCKTTIDKLEQVSHSKGTWLSFKQHIKGQSLIELIPDIIHTALSRLPIPKPMRWADKNEQFVRPVHWVLMLYGKNKIATTILGEQTTDKTYGHRFHHPKGLVCQHANDYAKLLEEKGYVIADFQQRQTIIQTQLAEIEKKHKIAVMVNNDLLNEVTSIVEWPKAYLCDFDKQFLEVPKEALIAAMQDHQKCFPVVDEYQQLLPHFVMISNIESKKPERVIIGNQRVMRSRLKDATFFYTMDSKQRLHDRLDMLKHVVFQAKLGTLYDKVQRLTKIARFIAEKIKIQTSLAERAALLSKSDLMTDMVGEFPELQGIMGYYYALNDGETKEVAVALKEQYLPRFSKDALPDSQLGCILALADRIDTLVAIFGINQIPTGEKDPFGLRRAAIGIIRLMIERAIDFDLHELIELTANTHSEPLHNQNVVSQVEDFLFERLRYWYQERGIGMDVVQAVLANRPTNPLDFDHRVEAVLKFQQLPDAESLAIANKRVKNILQKEGQLTIQGEIEIKLLSEPAEIELANQLNLQEKKVTPLTQEKDYVGVLNHLATLRKPVDLFFDEVMVIVEDEKLKKNRLKLLARLHHLFMNVADISVLQ